MSLRSYLKTTFQESERVITAVKSNQMKTEN